MALTRVLNISWQRMGNITNDQVLQQEDVNSLGSKLAFQFGLPRLLAWNLGQTSRILFGNKKSGAGRFGRSI